MVKTIYLVMGVSGSGKSSIASSLAKALEVEFIDGDDLHPQSNIDKMTAGIALNDDDRGPWLDTVNQQLRLWQSKGVGGVMVCSALKRVYRERLKRGVDIQFLFLDAPQDVIEERMTSRQGHFMKSTMLASQFATLERPESESNVWIIDAQSTEPEVLNEILDQIDIAGLDSRL